MNLPVTDEQLNQMARFYVANKPSLNAYTLSVLLRAYFNGVDPRRGTINTGSVTHVDAVHAAQRALAL
jgi:hypothetical protein